MYNKETFKKALPPHANALRKSGFKENLVYRPKTTTNKVIWFNPPYSVNVKASIGKIFLSLLKKHFLKKNKLHKIFNKNNIKISYSCVSNISIIAGHYKSLLQPKITKCGCNCRVKNTCPLQNQCQIPNLIYEADVENEVNNEKKIYFGLAATTFKDWFGNHQKDFNYKQYMKNAELSKYTWPLEDVKMPYIIKWCIVEKGYGKTKLDRCSLCLADKLYLIEHFDDIRLLNERSEFINQCRHQNKLLLKSLKRKDSMD